MPASPAGDVVALPQHFPGMRIGIFGGSFDPAHEGHRQVSLVGLRALGLDQVWWLVSPQNPLKSSAPSEDLARRVHAARQVASNPRIRVTGIEATLGTNYTAETLRKLLPRLAGVSIVWMMGADNLAQFHRWRDWQAIAASVPIAIFNRPGLALKALAGPAARTLAPFRVPEQAAANLAASAPPAWTFLSRPHIPLSSTELRALRKPRDAS
jgi:nicotinate-nucleotide adenylyltransferase